MSNQFYFLQEPSNTVFHLRSINDPSLVLNVIAKEIGSDTFDALESTIINSKNPEQYEGLFEDIADNETRENGIYLYGEGMKFDNFYNTDCGSTVEKISMDNAISILDPFLCNYLRDREGLFYQCNFSLCKKVWKYETSEGTYFYPFKPSISEIEIDPIGIEKVSLIRDCLFADVSAPGYLDTLGSACGSSVQEFLESYVDLIGY